jgi:hypothetical protein
MIRIGFANILANPFLGKPKRIKKPENYGNYFIFVYNVLDVSFAENTKSTIK